MKLSTSFLLESLKSFYNFAECHKKSDALSLERPIFFQSGMALSNHRIYILYDDFPSVRDSLPPDCVFLCHEGKKDLWGFPAESLCLFPDTVSLIEVFNHIQRLFDECDRWDEQLLRLQMEEGSIHQMLEISYSIFRNPILVQNLDFTTIASCHIPDTANDRLSLASFQDMEFINAMKQNSYFNKVREWSDVFLFPDYITGFRSLNLNIKKYHRTAFRIIILEQETSFHSYDSGFLKHLGTYVSYALLHNVMQRPGKDKTLHTIFMNLLSNRNADYMAISAQLSASGWMPEHTYLCMTLQITYLDVQNLTVHSICEYVENVISGSCAFSYHDHIAVFVNLDLFGGETEDISEKLIYFIRDSFLKLSFSNTVKGHMHLRRQYLQARAAQEIGGNQKPYLWIHHFSRLALPYIFHQATIQIPGSMLCHEKLLKLQEYDKEQSTEYMKTLEVYLRNHLNAVQSARDLFIHRSTFLYRLEKICKILDSDLTDYEELLYLMISFYLLREERPDPGSV